MSRIKTLVPHLWFDRQAREAAEFYCSVFPASAIDYVSQLHDTPSGDCDVVSFRIGGQPFMAISAGPHFRFTPAISFVANFDPGRDPQARASLDAAWEKLAEGGKVLIPLDEHFFAKRYGWVQDRYGVSWQLILSNPESEPRPFIVPMLMFTGEVCGKAEEAGAFYRSVFDGSRVGQLLHWPPGTRQEREGTVMFSDFRLGETWVSACDSIEGHGPGFNEAISFVIHCQDQTEIDRYWSQLSAVPQSEQCGWCKDRYGVSWQVVPAEMDQMLRSEERERVARLTGAFLKMKKFDLAALRRAFDGAA
jgi:predicted 3-demethylubiquinone-9 3-methyltransferase (glyoxalase superfamily)